MNLRILLIFLVFFTNQYVSCMYQTKNSNYLTCLNDVPNEVIVEKKSKKAKISNTINLCAQYKNASIEKLDASIKITDHANKMTIYLASNATKNSNPLVYSESIKNWINNTDFALTDTKYIDPTNQRYIGEDKNKKNETIRIHRFAIEIDSYKDSGKKIEEINPKSGENLTRIILQDKVKYDEQTQERDCYFVYIFDSTGKCFHRNMAFDLKQYGLPSVYIPTTTYEENFPALA